MNKAIVWSCSNSTQRLTHTLEVDSETAQIREWVPICSNYPRVQSSGDFVSISSWSASDPYLYFGYRYRRRSSQLSAS